MIKKATIYTYRVLKVTNTYRNVGMFEIMKFNHCVYKLYKGLFCSF